MIIRGGNKKTQTTPTKNYIYVSELSAFFQSVLLSVKYAVVLPLQASKSI